MPTDPDRPHPPRPHRPRPPPPCGQLAAGQPQPATHAGIATDSDARALAVVLDILADQVPHLDADVRWQTIESCRIVLDEADADPQPQAR